MRRLAIVPALLVLAACSQPSIADRLVAGQWVDLTYDFDLTTIYWPTAQPREHDTGPFGRTETAFSRSRPRCVPRAGPPQGRCGGNRHAEHRLRPVDDVPGASPAVRLERAGL